MNLPYALPVECVKIQVVFLSIAAAVVVVEPFLENRVVQISPRSIRSKTPESKTEPFLKIIRYIADHLGLGRCRET